MSRASALSRLVAGPLRGGGTVRPALGMRLPDERSGLVPASRLPAEAPFFESPPSSAPEQGEVPARSEPVSSPPARPGSARPPERVDAPAARSEARSVEQGRAPPARWAAWMRPPVVRGELAPSRGREPSARPGAIERRGLAARGSPRGGMTSRLEPMGRSGPVERRSSRPGARQVPALMRAPLAPDRVVGAVSRAKARALPRSGPASEGERQPGSAPRAVEGLVGRPVRPTVAERLVRPLEPVGAPRRPEHRDLQARREAPPLVQRPSLAGEASIQESRRSPNAAAPGSASAPVDASTHTAPGRASVSAAPGRTSVSGSASASAASGSAAVSGSASPANVAPIRSMGVQERSLAPLHPEKRASLTAAPAMPVVEPDNGPTRRSSRVEQLVPPSPSVSPGPAQLSPVSPGSVSPGSASPFRAESPRSLQAPHAEPLMPRPLEEPRRPALPPASLEPSSAPAEPRSAPGVRGAPSEERAALRISVSIGRVEIRPRAPAPAPRAAPTSPARAHQIDPGLGFGGLGRGGG